MAMGAPPNWKVLVPEELAVGAADAAPLAAVVVVVEEAPNWNVLAGGVAVAADDDDVAPQLPNRDLADAAVAVLAEAEEDGAVSPPNRPAPPPTAAAAGVATVTVAAGADVAGPKTLLLFVAPKKFVKVGTAGLLSCTDVGAVVDAPKMGLKPEVSVADVAAPNRPDEVIPAVAAVVIVWAKDDDEEELAAEAVEARVAVGFTSPNRLAPLEAIDRG